MNELQIRLTADIQQLQSALTKAKATIKSFESETAKESEKGNVGFKRKIGLIEQLTIKANSLRTALSKATNEAQIEAYNKELQNTATELTRLNALGRSVTANLSGVGGGFNKVATQGGNATGVALEFNRVIQDAPFGLIGIGNNLQQLAGNFSTLKAQAGSTGKAVGLALTSIISPVNLGLLAVSALTAAFTAYQMGAFDFLKSNEVAAKSVKELAEEIDNASSRTSSETANISALRTVIEDETLSREKRLSAVERLQAKYPEIFGNANKEKLLNGELIGSYELLTKAIIQRAEASLAEERIPELNKEKQAVDSLIKVKQKQLETEIELAKNASSFVQTGTIFSQADIAKAKVSDLQKEIQGLGITSKGLQINIDGFAESIVSYQSEFIDLLEPLNTDLGETSDKVQSITRNVEKLPDFFNQALDRINLDKLDLFSQKVEQDITVESGKATTQGIIEPEDDQNIKIQETTKLLEDQKISVDDLSSAFTGLGSLIGKAFDNPGFGQFAGQFAQFVTKIIAGAFAVSKANAIAGATQSSLFTGPAAAFTLPAFIAGAIGLVASAFAGLGGGGGGKGSGGVSGASSGKAPQIFTNQSTVQPPTPTSPNYSGSSIDFNNAQSRMTVDIDGDKLKFIVDRATERKQAGG